MHNLAENLVIMVLLGGVAWFFLFVILQSRKAERASKEHSDQPAGKKEAGP